MCIGSSFAPPETYVKCGPASSAVTDAQLNYPNTYPQSAQPRKLLPALPLFQIIGKNRIFCCVIDAPGAGYYKGLDCLIWRWNP